MKFPGHLKLLIPVAAATIAFASTAKLKEAYYGTNYTAPFAHAYRALGELGVDRKTAIDRDVYHISRLGLNAFRLHLWDVEISDSVGNLIDNDHLDLLDYLIAEMEKRGIAVMLTAQTNFGNGYPERNTDPNRAFTYRYDKCRIHDDQKAVDAQERYITQLVKHRNRYTGKTYAEDPDILIMEINNEPCHSGSGKEITAYIDRMVKALRKAGWKKDIVYNASHNIDRASAFFDADIDGATYQWYPTGLVHGERRRGNFLPVLDSYDIPYDTIPNYREMPRIIYEYDPGDVLESYLYPAAARTFRKAGFDWITQFAYDPIDMARFNTEYQTHFLNLAYTPGKAVGMAIAAEATRSIPKGKDYGQYPKDTIFGDFLVSARRNLAILNDGEKYYHTGNTSDAPKNLNKLKNIIGVGNSPLVTTDGSGAYFIDRLDNHTWRLELMPDVILTDDPFKRPSLDHPIAQIADSPITLRLNLPGLGEEFSYIDVTADGARPSRTPDVEVKYKSGKASGSEMRIMPGVYLISDSSDEISGSSPKWKGDMAYGDGRKFIGEYAMPPVAEHPISVVNLTSRRSALGEPIKIRAIVGGSEPIDSVKIFAGDVSFWRHDNEIADMCKSGKYEYAAEIPAQQDKSEYDYNIVVYSNDKAITFPSREEGTPLDWDFAAGRSSASPLEFYKIEFSDVDSPIKLYGRHNDSWKGDADDREAETYSKYVGDIMADHQDFMSNRDNDAEAGIKLKIKAMPSGKDERIEIGVVDRDGFTFSAPATLNARGEGEVTLSDLKIADTYLLPEPYPAFMSRTFTPDNSTAHSLNYLDIEKVVFTTPAQVISITLEKE